MISFPLRLSLLVSSLALTVAPCFAQATPEPQVSSSAALPEAPSAVNTSIQLAEVDPQAAPLPKPKSPQDQPSGVISAGQESCEAEAIRKQSMTPEQLKAEESQYIGGIVPNFNTVINRGGCVPKLTAGQKWNLVYHSATAPFTIGLDVLLAGEDELTGAHNGYGWGAQGYFKRFGAQYADTVSSAVIGNALLPIILKQDPRYYQIGPGHPIVRRAVHAALSTFICKGDNGKTQFNTSNVVGNFLSGALSNAYYPSADRGIGLTISSAVTVTLEGAFGAQLLEFSTELSHLLSHHRKTPDPNDPNVPLTAIKPAPAKP